jgi:hypothetical protein
LNKEPLYCLFEVGAKVKLRPGSESWVFHRALRKKVLTIKSIRLLSNVGLKDSNEAVVYQTYIELCNGKTFSVIDLLVVDEATGAVLAVN